MESNPYTFSNCSMTLSVNEPLEGQATAANTVEQFSFFVGSTSKIYSHH